MTIFKLINQSAHRYEGLGTREIWKPYMAEKETCLKTFISAELYVYEREAFNRVGDCILQFKNQCIWFTMKAIADVNETWC